MANFLAVDLGASNGRVLVGRWDGTRFELEELHRFPNGPTRILDHIHWDVLKLWDEIKQGLSQYSSRFSEPPVAIAVDTWGVDYGLLDSRGNLLGNPYHYRDARTDGVPARLFEKVPREQVFAVTGIQFMQLNTIFQIYSMVEEDHPQLRCAETMLLMPDLFNYWLTGAKLAEYTIATTTQMFDAVKGTWACGLLEELGVPARILPPLVAPGSEIGTIQLHVAGDTGLPSSVRVIAGASHDTASAVAAVPGLDEDSAYLSSGTWSLMGIETRQPVINEQSLRLNVTNEGGVEGRIRLLKNIAGLWLLQECRRKWQREGQDYSWQELLVQARSAQPLQSLVDPDAPDFLNPGDMPAAIQAYCRRTNQPEPVSPGEVVRCCLESLALKYRQVLGLLEQLAGKRLPTVRIVGGGCLNDLLCQFTADACSCAVVSGPVEATALGNIMVQAMATGFISDLEEGREAIARSVKQQRYEPSGQDWREAAARFDALLDS
jgi:rhamnulokinase